jgi:Acyltransferase family/Heparan-alpha-glucosaminide N-acetyltransferase, catalytic
MESTAEIAASGSTPVTNPSRLASLDQFRGYTVAGMFLVNFVGSYAAIAAFLPTLKHWNNHCSYADTIMPQFLLAVGFSFRMSYLKRREQLGKAVANWRVVRRILGLLLVALIVHQLDSKPRTWDQLVELGPTGFFSTAFQRNYFQTLTHIGLTSLFAVPVIGASVVVRLLYAVGSCVFFIYLSSNWYYDWEMTTPGIDGGPLGFLTWIAPLILGTVAFDICSSQIKYKAAAIFAFGCVAMLLGYLLSCISLIAYPNQLPSNPAWQDRLAEHPFQRPVVSREGQDFTGQQAPELDNNALAKPLDWYERLIVAGADIPPPKGEQLEHWVIARKKAFEKARSQGEAVPAQPDELAEEKWYEADQRYLNQWTISQRSGSPAYTIFGGGFGLFILSLMMVLCDRWGWQIGLFRTLGVNALIAYILHDMVNNTLKPFVPKDAPLWYVLSAFVLSFLICYIVLRNLEKQRIFVRL